MKKLTFCVCLLALMALALAVTVAPTALGDLQTECPSATSSPDPLDPIIDNGIAQLGINPEAHLNVCCGDPSFQSFTPFVGLRYLPSNGEATAPGCLCEGWGVANADAGTGIFAAYANVSVDGGPVNLVLQSATTTGAGSQTDPDSVGTGFTSVVMDGGGRVKVTHDYQPSSHPNLYQATVTIENIGLLPIGDLRYRRVMDWDIPDTTFHEWVEIHVGTAVNLIRATSDGFLSANPLNPAGPFVGNPPTTLTPGSPDYFAGPSDQGASFDFGFGPLAVGATKSFRIRRDAHGRVCGDLVGRRGGLLVRLPVEELRLRRGPQA
jgi:hypothetical protein